MDVDYDIYAEGEAELGWLNSSNSRHGAPAVRLTTVLDIIRRLRTEFSTIGAETAHLRRSACGKAFTRGEPREQLHGTGIVASVELPSVAASVVVNARVATDPANLNVSS